MSAQKNISKNKEQHHEPDGHHQLTSSVRIGFALVLGMIIVLGVVGSRHLKMVSNSLTTIIEVNNAKTSAAYNMRDAIRLRALATHAMKSETDYFVRDNLLLEFYEYAGRYRLHRQLLLATELNEEEKKIDRQLTRQSQRAQPVNRKAAELLLLDDASDEELHKALEQASLEQKKILDLLDQLVNLQKSYEVEAVRAAREEYQDTFYLMLVMIVAALLIGVLITRSVERFVKHKGQELHQKNVELEEAYNNVEKASHVRSEFLANMSHEIRTPMNGVIGTLEMLNDTSLSKDQQHLTKVARSSAEALLKIIDDILDFSKIDAGKLEFEHIDFDLVQVVEDVVELNAKNISDTDIELVTIIPPAMNCNLVGDPVRLWQLLNNLLGNAIKFTRHGEITIEVRKLENYSMYCFEIRDTGVGISTEAQSRIFDSFTQADGSTTRNYGGTGLGLSICKQLASLFGGEIGCDSKQGEGSTFWFTAKLEEADTPPDNVLPVDGLDGLRVLVVDDNETSRQALMTVLHSWKLQVRLVGRGQDALVMLNRAVEENRPYDVVLIDQSMQELDGLTLVRYINENPRLASLKKILMSTRRDVALKEDEASLSGIDGFVDKPLRRQDVYDRIAIVAGLIDGDSDHPELPAESEAQESTPELIRNGRILLVEDNEVNQKVASRMLEKLGCEIDIAENGEVACDQFTMITYDLIIMDCQMPVVDGYEATRKIRKYEGSEQLKRTPIVAMTANAMQGDREKCLESGMDDYMTKPVRIKNLQAILNKWLSPDPSGITRQAGSGHGGASTSEKYGPEHLDNRVLEDIVDNLGEESMAEIARLFVNTGKDLVEKLNSTISDNDIEGLHFLAHTLKGSSANIGANQLMSFCDQLDKETRANADFETMKRHVAEINSEFKLITRFLKKAS